MRAVPRWLAMYGVKRGRADLEEVLAEVVGDHGPERGESADALSANLERDVEEAESHKAHRVGMLLIVRVEKRNEDAEELLDRRQAIRRDLSICVPNISFTLRDLQKRQTHLRSPRLLHSAVPPALSPPLPLQIGRAHV